MINTIGSISDLRNFLRDTSDGKYYVTDSSKQANNAVGIEHKGKRVVQCFRVGTSYPKEGVVSYNSDVTAETTARIQITITETSSVDLNVLNDPNSTDQQRIDALNATFDAEDAADMVWDEVQDHIFNNVMGADGETFGNSGNSFGITDRWGRDARKEPTVKSGSLIVLTGSFDIDFSVQEIPNGDTPVPEGILSGRIDIQQGDGDELAIETGGHGAP